MRRNRLAYGVLSAALIVLALASRRYGAYLPTLISTYAGDTLWALMVYVALGAVWPRARPSALAAIALATAYLVEGSQLYHAPWIDSVRRTAIGGLVLGHGFLWSDVVCYTLGVGAGWLTELLASRPGSRRALGPADETECGSPTPSATIGAVARDDAERPTSSVVENQTGNRL